MARPSAPDKPAIGRETILAGFKSRPARAARHIVTNIVVDIESETEARAQSIIVLYQGNDNPMAACPSAIPRAARRDLHGPAGQDRRGWRFAERVGGLDFAP